ncbi:hypothetical protein [Pantoea eucalypti]|uniref:hypothetical protein n=1 Tax=Pantoea eucalypti TaxID=470933 RepID=UPI00099AE01E|nr:hypothetical protein [Pantoea eucalypti]SJZ36270.1 hypothetical protein SAMN03097723_0757 [Pantoea eucalypti]
MAKKEVIHNNTKLNEALKRTTYNSLSPQAKIIINEAIQNCASLGKYKLPVEDVYYIIRNASELSKAQVLHHLTIYRTDRSKKLPNSDSSIEKYKKACISVAEALEAFVEGGGLLCGIKAAMEKVLPAKPMNDEQKQAVQELLNGNASASEVIAFLQTIR